MRIYYCIVATIIAWGTIGCDSSDDTASEIEKGEYRQEMRELVIGISRTAKATRADFAIIPQNGIELITQNGEPDGILAESYLAAIDAHGQEDLFFGYDNDNVATPSEASNYLKAFLDRSKTEGKKILVTDYCNNPDKIAVSYQLNAAKGYTSYAAPERNLNAIPGTAPREESEAIITHLGQVKNFLYLINPENYNSKAAYITAVTSTNYDLLIMDLFFNDEAFTAAEVNQLRLKANGGRRMVICYMSIGEAENYRYYWDPSWNTTKPDWIVAENPDWPGNYKVQYWNETWQALLYKNPDSYLNKIMSSGYDGVYLDIIDAFEYFEN
ncbi:endo alpha-1,4 polygalactosaminidase [Flavobacterium kingsejongi]|uniref:Glycoside-hydrolase family GH114 TIM-barrel domain-containing protein n=1 Tax=Flavobacterium kingsejongi TaxID=1678728 RepID=A0A2S1LQU2_9FLAO|nr:endo alpha-1,4 polygalactosaminidase [Flavobacterium kingsejongi]AWG26125.1 hypothetical protein FK004_13250 [Flavobacterium kingsejongi]